jgi:ribosomal subunit interface protein
MQTRITARHFQASDGLRSYIARSLGRLERYYDRGGRAHVVLTDGRAETADKKVEIALSAPRQTFTSAYTADTHEAAVDGCVRQLRRQAVRYKERGRWRRAASGRE